MGKCHSSTIGLSSDREEEEFEQRFAKIVIVGDSSVGKTSLLRRYFKNEFDGCEVPSQGGGPSLGLDCLSKSFYIDGKDIRLHFWDTAGQERFRSITASYLRGASACILVFDVTKIETFESLDYWYGECLKQNLYQDTLPKFFLLGNKIDLLEAAHGSISAIFVQVSKWLETHQMFYSVTSAKTKQSVTQTFQYIQDVVLFNELHGRPKCSNTTSVSCEVDLLANTKNREGGVHRLDNERDCIMLKDEEEEEEEGKGPPRRSTNNTSVVGIMAERSKADSHAAGRTTAHGSERRRRNEDVLLKEVKLRDQLLLIQ